MSEASAQNSQSDAGELETATDRAIALCDGDIRAALRASIVAKEQLEKEVTRLQAAVSSGYARGRVQLPRDRKDWYD
jgi:hypothetical protein